jgi:antitoxin component HigA of HigAB toxin-antitoxin module
MAAIYALTHDDDDTVNLSDRIRANIRHLIEARGYTYSELGLGSRQDVCHVLSGSRGLSLKRVDAFAKSLGVDVVDLCREPSA